MALYGQVMGMHTFAYPVMLPGYGFGSTGVPYTVAPGVGGVAHYLGPMPPMAMPGEAGAMLPAGALTRAYPEAGASRESSASGDTRDSSAFPDKLQSLLLAAEVCLRGEREALANVSSAGKRTHAREHAVAESRKRKRSSKSSGRRTRRKLRPEEEHNTYVLLRFVCFGVGVSACAAAWCCWRCL